VKAYHNKFSKANSKPTIDSSKSEEANMTTGSNELRKWVEKFQRKLDSVPLTRWDREELEELMTVIVNVAVKQMVQTPAQPAGSSNRGNGGER
jgi:hypothetical protein